MKESKSFSVKGKVQGVGFRMHVKICAEKFAVKGWVKNDFDGSVSGEACGESENMNSFFEEIRKGNSLAKVKSLETSSIPYREFDSFEIRY